MDATQPQWRFHPDKIAWVNQKACLMRILGKFLEPRPLWRILLVLFAVPAVWAQSTTTTTLTVSSSSVTTGTAVTLTASVLSSGAAVTAGQVVFCDATAKYCEGPAVFGSAWMIKS